MGVYKKDRRGNKDVWWIDYYYQGRRIRECTGTSKTMAEKALVVRKAEILQGRYKLKAKTQGATFKELAEKYLVYSKTNKKVSSHTRDISSLKQLAPFFKGRKLEGITPYLVEEYKQERLKKVMPATVNREVLCLKKMFSLAVDWNLAMENQMISVKLLKVAPKAVRILYEEEEDKLLASSKGMPKAIIICFLHTGMRLRECLDLEWSNISLREGQITLDNTKNNRIREIPLNSTLMSLFRRLPETSKWVFPSSYTSKPYTSSGFKNGFDRTLRRAGIRGLTPHGLRYTFCTRLMSKGCDPASVRDIMGHSSFKMLSKYSHASKENKKKAVSTLDRGKQWTPTGHLEGSRECVQNETEV